MQPGLSLYNAFILQVFSGGGKAEEDEVREEPDKGRGSEGRSGSGLVLASAHVLLLQPVDCLQKVQVLKLTAVSSSFSSS